MTNNINNLFDGLDVSSTDELLKNIDYIEVPEDAKKRIMRLVYKNTGLNGKPHRPFWVIPAAAVIAAIIAVVSIPDARAAVADLFNRMFSVPGYMAQDTAERPAISEIDTLIQTPIPSKAVSSASGKENLPEAGFTDVSDDPQFLKNDKVRISETLYDGKSIIIMADLIGDLQNFYNAETGDLTPEYYHLPSSCAISFTDKDGITKKFDGTARFLPPNTYSNKYKGGKLDSLKLEITIDSQNNKLILSGIQNVSITLTLRKEVKIDAKNSECVPIGTCTLNYSFDPTAGNDSFKTASPNKIIDLKGEATISEVTQKSGYMLVKNTSLPLDGCEFKLSEVSRSPLSITIKVLYKCSGEWTDIQKTGFTGGDGYSLLFHVILNGQEYTRFNATYGECDKTWSYAELDLPIIANDQKSIHTLELLPFINYLTEVNGVKITSEQKKISVNNTGEEGGWTQESGLTTLSNFKIAIDLP